MRDLCQSYGGRHVLHHVSFSLAPGEVVAYLGPNGSGKTTTVKVLAGLLEASFGRVLHDADRISHGELYFALSIGVLLLASNGESFLYVVPLLILTIADAAAAVVGRAFPLMPLSGLAKGKTASGCATFFVVALLVTLPTLIGLTDISPGLALTVAVTVSVATCIAEAISSRGFDNLAVPAVALFILKLLVAGAA